MSSRISVTAGEIDFGYSLDRLPPRELDIRHCHDMHEILFITSGKGRIIIEGADYDIRERTLVVIDPLAYHYVQVDKDTAYERYVINFPSSALSEDTAALLAAMTGDGSGGRYYPPHTVSHSVLALFERFATAAQLPDSERTVYARALLSELIALLSVSGGEQTSGGDEELGARVIRYLNENIDKNITLDQLAKRFFVSKYYLCRAFKKHNGISVHGYINRKRVMYAKQLIDSGETASGAAYKVGFGDYSAFYRAYVKIIGKSPTAD